MFGYALLHFSESQAKPSGFHLREGDAKAPVQKSSNSFVIESSQNTMIDWESFSIDPNEHVRFEQLQNTYVLNRVTGKNESAILGSLTSNGAVYLVNPNGILIGKEASIDTAGFIASTLDLLDSDLSSKHFSGESSKGIVNLGKIHSASGDIFLIGHTVENSGCMEAPEGRLGLLSGFDVVICPEKAPQVLIRVEESFTLESVKENPYALAIRHSGITVAKEVCLIAEKGVAEVSGSISAVNGDVGGSVRILGDEVVLLGEAIIDVSGIHGGGEALLGGDRQGKNPDIQNAKHLWLASDAQIHADALISGDGGKIVLWSDQATIAYGTITALGGLEAGNGGFIEISSPGSLIPNARVSTLAPHGKSGLLFLDPCVVTISTGTDGGFTYAAPNYTFTAAAATINTTTLQTQLAATSVIINATSTGSAPAGSGSITVNNPVSWSQNSTLTLIAEENITINAPITSTYAAGNFSAIAMTTTGSASGTIGILIAADVSTVDGDIVLNGTSASSSSGAHGISLSGGALHATGLGTISLTGDPGTGLSSFGNSLASNITTHGQSITIVGSTILAANVDLDTTDGGSAPGGAAIDFSGLGTSIDGAFDLTLNGNAVNFDDVIGLETPIQSLSVVTPGGTGTITTSADNIFSIGDMTFDGAVILAATNRFTSLSGDVIFNSSITGNQNLTITANSGSATVLGTINLSGAALSGAISGRLSATGSTGLVFGGEILTQGGTSIGVGGSGGSVTLRSSQGSISLHNINASGGTGATRGNAGDITVAPSGGYSGGFPLGLIIVNADLSSGFDGNFVSLGGASGSGNGTVTLSANREPSTVATITSSLGGNSIKSRCGSFVMGSNEAMTAFGSIDLGSTSSLTLGDIVALTDLTLDSPIISLRTHGDETLYNNLGQYYTSPTLHFMAGGVYTETGTLNPSGPINAKSLGLPPSAFLPLLTYQGTRILNYDSNQIFPPGPAPQQFVIYELAVCGAQLSDMLPIFEPACPPIVRHKSMENCRKYVTRRSIASKEDQRVEGKVDLISIQQ